MGTVIYSNKSEIASPFYSFKDKKKKNVLRESKSCSCQPVLSLILLLAIACLITRDIIPAQGFGQTATKNKVPTFLRKKNKQQKT